MTSIKRIVASLAVGAGLMLPAAIGGAQAAPVSAATQNFGIASQAAGSQVELIKERGGPRWRHGGGGGPRWKHGGGGSGWKHGGGGWKPGYGGKKWSHKGNRWRHRHSGFYFASPFFYNDYGYYGYYGYYDDYPYYSSSYDNYCYRECREEHGPRYCRRYWRRYC